MFKRIWPFFVMCLMLMNTCGAQNLQEKSDDQYFVMIDKTKIFAKDLIITDGVDEYSDYQKMSGYPKEDRFTIYFCEKSPPNKDIPRLTVVDMRGIDLNELFEFTWPNGMPGRITRGDVERIFDKFEGTETEWFMRQTFPGAYEDWFEKEAFFSTAESLLKRYESYKYGIKNRDNTVKIAAGGVQGASKGEDENLDGTVKPKGIFGW